jgi:hypothetical protein
MNKKSFDTQTVTTHHTPIQKPTAYGTCYRIQPQRIPRTLILFSLCGGGRRHGVSPHRTLSGRAVCLCVFVCVYVCTVLSSRCLVCS